MTKPASILSALTATACITLNQPARAQAVDPKLGKVHFETSCSSDAAAAFDRGCFISTRSGIAHRNASSTRR
jgi:hypothetical protein